MLLSSRVMSDYFFDSPCSMPAVTLYRYDFLLKMEKCQEKNCSFILHISYNPIPQYALDLH